MPGPAVSVIVPTFNRSTMLARAVASVLVQSHTDWELIVVDDAGADDSEDVVAAFGDPRLRYVRRPINGGVAAAQNTGIDEARGCQLAFLHSDDELTPDSLRTRVQALEASGPDVGGVQGSTLYPATGHVGHPSLGSASMEGFVRGRTTSHVSAVLFRAEALTDVRFDERLRCCEDWDLLRRVRRSWSYAEVDVPVVSIRADAEVKLSSTPAMLAAMRLLEVEYGPEIAACSAQARAAWAWRGFRSALLAGRRDEARRYLRDAMRADGHVGRRAPLWIATWLGPRAVWWTWYRYRALAGGRSASPGRG